MNSVVPKYCFSQDPKSKLLSSYHSLGRILNDEIKIDLEYLLNFSSIKLTNTDKGERTVYTFEDENGSVILSGKANSSENAVIFHSNEEKILLRIEFSGDQKDVGSPMKRCKIFSSLSLLSYITIHPPMISLIKYDIRDANNKVYLTIESENCFSSEFLVKASNGIKTIAKLKRNKENLQLIILDSENLNLVSKVSLITLLLVMKCTSQPSSGNSLKTV